MNLNAFLDAPTAEIAEIVREQGPRVCVLPVNGTRRWFVLEKGVVPDKNNAEELVKATGDELRRLIGVLFDYGVETVISPVYGGELSEERGREYRRMAIQGLKLLTQQDFQEFYATKGIRVRFYGDYLRYFEDEADLLDSIHRTEISTAGYTRHRLFYGVCGESAVSIITKHAVKVGHALSHQEAIKAFYGESISLADLFIGFDAPTAFDMPLLDKGGVDLYFTLSPSPYLDRATLRTIVYDWIFIRNDEVLEYQSLNPEEFEYMRNYYQVNRRFVVGLGTYRNGVWYYQGCHFHS
jgi:hypothetical protein